MTLFGGVFYALSALIIVATVLAVTSRNVVHAVVYLVIFRPLRQSPPLARVVASLGGEGGEAGHGGLSASELEKSQGAGSGQIEIHK